MCGRARRSSRGAVDPLCTVPPVGLERGPVRPVRPGLDPTVYTLSPGGGGLLDPEVYQLTLPLRPSDREVVYVLQTKQVVPSPEEVPTRTLLLSRPRHDPNCSPGVVGGEEIVGSSCELKAKMSTLSTSSLSKSLNSPLVSVSRRFDSNTPTWGRPG